MDEPKCRATQLVAFRAATVRRWDLATWQSAIATLPETAREQMFPGGLPLSAGWVAEKHMMALSAALRDGPCQGSDTKYRELLRGSIDEGFGRVRKLFMQLAAPGKVLSRAPDLWRHDHTHGELIVEPGDQTARVIVRHPVLVSTALSCLTLTEMFRYILTLTRVPDVWSEYERETSTELRIQFRWKE